MLKYLETTGKTEDAAIQSALQQLNLDRDSVSVEILARAKSGFLGIGSQPARVRVTYEVPDEVVEVPAAPAPVVEEAPVVEAAPAPVVEEKAAEPAPKAEKKVVKEEKKSYKKGEKSERKRTKKAKPAAVPAPEVEEVKAAPAAPAEPAEDRSERIITFLSGLLKRLDSDAEPVILSIRDDIYQVELVGEGLGALIGRRGETLDAIQQLTNYAVNHDQSRRVRIHIDAENYRSKREESLQRLARKTAGKAMKYRRNMMLEPMNAYERHVIHAALQDYNPSISTYSTGTEPNRRIVVAYNRAR